MGIKIALIGGASNYTPELFDDLFEFCGDLDVEQVTLMDLNAEKLALIAGVCGRLLDGSGKAIQVATTLSREEAFKGADFVILQLRVGGLDAQIRDETVPMELGMVGNETTGPGGFACALRTIPLILEIARDVERLAPNAWILNLANPAGIVTEAILKHTQARVLGFCNIPINTTYALAEALDVEPATVRLDSFGLNHLSWTRGVYVDGQELLQPLMAKTNSRDSVLYRSGLVETMIAPEWLRTLGMIPGWYLRYFYYPERILEEDRELPHTRGVEDKKLDEEVQRFYTTEGYGAGARRIQKERGGSQYYLPVVQVIDSIVHDRGDVIVADVRNGKALPDLPPDVCVEVPARIGKDQAEPVPVGPMPLSVRGLVQTVKTYEELTVEAAVTGDQGIAIAALMANPLVGSYPKARAFMDRVLENERPYLTPRFFE